MSGITKPELAGAMPDLGATFLQVSSEATRRLCKQGQSVTQTISEWNSEISHFLTTRVARNGEAMGSMTKCQSFPEIFAVQAQWAQDAAGDYLCEMSKLMEVNRRIMSGMLGSVGRVETRSSSETPASPEALSSSETTASPEARSAPETPASPEARSSPETPASPEALSSSETPASPEARSAPETPASPEARSSSETPASPEARSSSEKRSPPATRSSPAKPSPKTAD